MFQTLGTLLSGTLMDMYGTKGVFVINFISSAVCYAMFYLARDAWWLYMAQIPTLLQHGMLAARTYLSIHAKTKEEAERLLGLTRFAYGAGMTIGPALGGWLADHVDLRAPAGIAMVGSVISCLTVLWLDDGGASAAVKPSSGDAGDAAAKPAAKPTLSVGSVLSQMATAASNVASVPALRAVFFVRFLGLIAGSLAYRALPVAAKSHFDMGASGLGALMSFAAVAGVVAQGSVLALLPAVRAARANARKAGTPPPAWALSDTSIVLAGLAVVGAGFAALSLATTFEHLMAAIIVVVVGPVLVDVILAGRIASLATDKGFANSVDMAVGSVLRSIAAPYAAAWLVSELGFASVGRVSAALIVLPFVAVASGWASIEDGGDGDDAAAPVGGRHGTKED